jgi:hypothetical protein
MFLGSSVAHVPVPSRIELLQKRVDAIRLDVRGLTEETKQLEASYTGLRASWPKLLLALERVSNQFQYSAFTLVYFIRIPCCLMVCSVPWSSTTLAIF